MGVNNGQNVDEVVTNAAFMDKNEDTFTVGKVELQNPQAESGANITNTQRELNANKSYTGMPSDSAIDVKPAWVDSTQGTVNDTLKDRADALTTRATANQTDISTNTANIATNTQNIDDTKQALGLSSGEVDMGTYTGDIISDNVDQKTINQELESAIAGIPAGLKFKGNWDASTNTPALTSGGAGNVEGDYYRVSVAGTTDLDGITDWEVGDFAALVDDGSGGQIWEKIDNTTSINSTDDLPEGLTNLYYTDTRVDDRISVASIDDLSDVDTTTTPPDLDEVLKWDGVNWVPGVGGGSGQGGINYLEGDSTNFEGGTVGDWVQYKDAALPEPEDGTGGSASLTTFQASNLSLLRGDWLGNLGKIAGDAQGEGVSIDFSVDDADLNSSLYISFDYFTTGAYELDDLLVFVYDVTEGQLTPVSRSGDSKRFTGRFSTGSSNDYRLILHVASTNPLAWGFAFDNIQVGPEKIIDVPIVENYDQVVSSPTVLTPGTEITSVTNLRLSGTRTGGAYSLGLFFNFNMISGNDSDEVVIDKNDFPFLQGKTITNINGSFNTNVNSSSPGEDFAFGYVRSSGGNLAFNFYGNFQNTTNRQARGSLVIYVEEEANQSGIISDKETLNATAKARFFRDVNQTINSSTREIIRYNNVTYNEGNGFELNTSTGEVTVLRNMTFQFQSSVRYGSHNVAELNIFSLRNNTTSTTYSVNSPRVENGVDYNLTDTVQAKKGDVISIGVDSSTDTNYVVSGASTICYFSLQEVVDLSVYGVTGAIKKTQTKILTSDITTDGPISDLTFNNLTIGQWYEINLIPFLDKTNANGEVDALIVHDGVTLARARANASQGGGTMASHKLSSGIIVKFQATDTVLEISGDSFSSGNFIRGNGTREETHATLTEIEPLQETNEF